MAGGVAIQQPGGMISPQPQGAVAASGGAPTEAQNTSQFLSWLARIGGAGSAFKSPYAPTDPASAIVSDAITPPPPGPPVMGHPQTAMGGSPGPRTIVPPPATQGAPPPPPAPAPGAPPGQPGAPPPSVPEEGSDNVAMGTGPGHAQQAGLGGAAAALGTQVAQDPNTTANIIKQLQTQGLANDSQNAWLALAQAGFTAAASRSPHALQALGEGASAGISAYTASRAARAQQLASAADIAYRQRASDIAQQQADTEAKRYAADTEIAQKKLPAELQELMARSKYYEGNANYKDAQVAGTIPPRATSGRASAGGGGKPAGGVAEALAQRIIDEAKASGQPVPTFSDALMIARGQQNRERDAYRRSYLNAQGLSTVPTDQAPADLIAKADAEFERSQGGGAAAPAAAPAAASAAPQPDLSQPSVGDAPGYADGQKANGGKLVAKDGKWYPAKQ